jgi:K+:H+ antiporter
MTVQAYASAINTIPVPTLSSHQLLVFLIQLSILLLSALLLGSLARRFHMPVIMGELCAGILLGPSVLGQLNPWLFSLFLPPTSEQYHLLDAVGQLGVLLLVGISGIGLNINILRRSSATVTRIGLFAWIIPLACGITLGYLLPDTLVQLQLNRLIFALFLGITMCVSAMPVMAKTLMDMNLLHRKIGQLSLSAGTIDDALGWLLLSIVAVMAVTGDINGKKFIISLFSICILLFLSWTIGKKIVYKILALVRHKKDEGPTVTAMFAMILGYAAVTQALGLEAVFGALICGILIGTDSKFREIRLPTVLAVLAPLFFATAGLRINLQALANPSILLAAVIVLTIAILSKFLAAYIGSRLSGLQHWESFAIGAAMNSRGIIEIVIANVGIQIGVLNTATYTIIILIALITSIMAAPLLRIAMAYMNPLDEDILDNNHTTKQSLIVKKNKRIIAT